MHAGIQTRQDSKRGCGWRKPGGMYLISGGVSVPCGLLPIELNKCPTCSCGIKPSRGWTWIDISKLKGDKICTVSLSQCVQCPLNTELMGEKQGLLWVGGKYYAKPGDWTAEAVKQGVSRRISQIPKDFKLGETWVLVAHREVYTKPCPDTPYHRFDQTGYECETCEGKLQVPQAAIFHAFKPSAIEYVVKGDETDEKIDKLIKRGITPVQVERINDDGDQAEMFDDEEEPAHA